MDKTHKRSKLALSVVIWCLLLFVFFLLSACGRLTVPAPIQNAPSASITTTFSVETVVADRVFGTLTASAYTPTRPIPTTSTPDFNATGTRLAEDFFATETALAPTKTPPVLKEIATFAYGNDAQLRASYTLNPAWGNNLAAIRLDNHNGIGLMTLTYTIRKAPPDDYVVVNRYYDSEQDWTGARYLDVWVENDNTFKQVIVQFGEQLSPAPDVFKGEVWRAFVKLAPGQTGNVKLALSDFSWVNWSPFQNGRIDLDRIGYFALGTQGTGLGQGNIYFGPVRILP